MTDHVGSVSPTRAPGVTARVSESVTFPAAGTRPEDDVRTKVALKLPEFVPWDLRVDFIRYHVVDDHGRRDVFELAGYEFGKEVTLEESEEALEVDEDRFRMTAEQVDRLHRYFWSYVRIAELRARFDDGAWEHRRHVLDDIREGTPRYRDLELLVVEYRAREGSETRIYDMAEALGCTRKTIWYYVREAFAAGLLEEHEVELRTATR